MASARGTHMPWNGPNASSIAVPITSLGAISSAAAVKSFGIFDTSYIGRLVAEAAYVVNSTTTAAYAALLAGITSLSGGGTLVSSVALNNAQGATVKLAVMYPPNGDWPWPNAEVVVNVGSGTLTASLTAFGKNWFTPGY